MTRQDFADRLTERAAVVGLTFSPDLLDSLFEYYAILKTWNRKINLTGIDLTELPAAGIDRLFVEPVAAAQYLRSGLRLIDIGSGGGSPAIPLALAARVSFLTMVESRVRKSVFLQEAARAVSLSSSVLTARFEDLVDREEIQKSYDALTSRAVLMNADSLAQLSLFVKPDGCLFLFSRDGSTRVPPGLRLEVARQLTGTATLLVLRNQKPNTTLEATNPSDVPRET